MRALLAVLCLLASAPALAQAPAVPRPPERELVVGTRVAPPFSMKDAEGNWEGLSIDLWRHVAERLGLRYRLEERDTVQALLDAVATGQVDAAAAALTVTAARRQAMDFTQPFFATGLGVAVGRGGATAWLPVLRTFLSFGFLQGVLTLLGIALLVGTLIWLFERRHHEAYGGPPLRGFIAGAWWSAVAMTQAGAAQDGPRSLPGRVLAVVWMVASVVTIAVFIAGITSALTTQRMQGVVRNVGDLRAIRVGAVAGSSTVEFLGAQRVAFEAFSLPAEGLRAVKAGRIDAFVYDRPLLAWTIQQDFPELEVLPITLDSQNYAIALPLENTTRVALDVALLETLRGEWWARTRLRYLGRDGAN
ncbi:substrate-binding periplasmic protein [Pseudoroseomonas ludipueritiae]|uniref:Transporter substrate-binding domain-containing protein n=1 Tax=Pseudoroseomonas ludipueritiae TaxID=198093 RepID=A0ABR7RCL1_9PROT|nr:transporter substrate-binding domain-containing protein [Pseudoroseomonas ludipueritiae]MBC9179175.1 transporter substrate-binding domain-containing protein [Pseudoroseomonas ludipueritiae]